MDTEVGFRRLLGESIALFELGDVTAIAGLDSIELPPADGMLDEPTIGFWR